ncbi:MAG TPA: proton-conducting transporter membrane subunit, partial [Steroidobacteraceae bacterium]|nr:proton-conducting transporter membrane subunit [Steroidobacteraceae bacterium]
SQLGYMTVALGVSAYSAGIFHLMTHAFFKALLFLGAGSVIIAMHHEQDMRRMGGLRRYLPVTYWTTLLGALALIGFPGFAGFFSKDALIEAVRESSIPGAGYAYFCVICGVFVTAFYSFRLVFLTFHGEERMDHHTREHLHESPWVVTLPLVLLAVPSVVIGWPAIGPLLFGDYFGAAIHVAPAHDVLGHLAEEFQGPAQFVLQGLKGPAVWLAAAGVASAWYLYLWRPTLAVRLRERAGGLYTLLVNKYYFDEFNEKVIAAGSRALGNIFWRGGDVALIDGAAVNGTARLVGWFSGVLRGIQSGYLYHYAFATIIGLSALLAWLLLRN